MTGPLCNKTMTETTASESLQRTLRIEHDRRRLAFAMLASGFATLALLVMLVVNIMHPAHPAPSWTLAPLGVAIVLAALGLLRNIWRLQDGDPALVISPRGLSFRPQAFGEIARIPWSAIRGFRSRSYQQQRFIAVQVDDPDRYAPRAGFLHLLRGLGIWRSASNEVGFSTPMTKAAWKEIEDALQRYLAQYGAPAAASNDGTRNHPSGEGLATRGDKSRSVS